MSRGLFSEKPMPDAAQPGVAVQHRDHDRHVGAADRDDDQHAENERDRRHRDERQPVRIGAGDHERDAERDHHDGQHQVDQVLALEDDWRAREQPEHLPQVRQLAEGNDRARERHRADERADEQLHPVAARESDRDIEGSRVADDGEGDEHGGQADERVHRRHQLRHLRHLDALGDVASQ